MQGSIWIINVGDTSSHGDTPMCQIWKANVKPKKAMGWTRICTDRQTHRRTEEWTDRRMDRQCDSYIPPELGGGGL